MSRKPFKGMGFNDRFSGQCHIYLQRAAAHPIHKFKAAVETKDMQGLSCRCWISVGEQNCLFTEFVMV